VYQVVAHDEAFAKRLLVDLDEAAAKLVERFQRQLVADAVHHQHGGGHFGPGYLCAGGCELVAAVGGEGGGVSL
ncbi:MAG TPA: hypothetical protein DCE81_08160, partial [Cytophagales bacterium]|nr:hypothetical protein [Cytophagales bacterium]